VQCIISMSSFTSGIVGVAMGAVFWGSNFIVLKGYEGLPDDGMCFVFLMATGVLIAGIGTLFANPVVHGDFEVVLAPDGILGGAVWALGNFLTVPIVKTLGLGLGFAIWVSVNLIVAFVIGMVGIGGDILPPEKISSPLMGITGAVLATIAVLLFSQVRPTLEKKSSEKNDVDDDDDDDDDDLTRQFFDDGDYGESGRRGSKSQAAAAAASYSYTSSAPKGSRIHNDNRVGIVLAIVAGTLYGVQFVPLSVWNKKIDDAGDIFGHRVAKDGSVTAVRFFFSQALGIFLVSFVGFAAYCWRYGPAAALVPPGAMLPCVASGLVWSLGCMGGILATAGLGNSVGFVLVLNLSLLVNSAWSVFYFREIEGQRDLRMFYLGCFTSIISSVLISLSKSAAVW
jgi:glucose uptake protein GlcU